jgi:beta-phosphoglucomutase-like phosphatase (HAD superfamily)
MLHAIVFDFDGVLANSEPLHFEVFRQVLDEIGITLTPEAYYSKYLGYDDLGAFQAVLRDNGRPDDNATVASLGAGDTPRSKPAPDPYARAVELLQARGLVPAGPEAASRCVAIEDSHWGIQSAKAAGLSCIAVTTSYAAAELGAADLVVPAVDALTLQQVAALVARG